MLSVLCYKDSDRQLQLRRKKKTKKLNYRARIVDAWKGGSACNKKRNCARGMLCKLCCQLSISDMITPLPSRETDADSEDVAVFFFFFLRNLSTASWSGTLPRRELIL